VLDLDCGHAIQLPHGLALRDELARAALADQLGRWRRQPLTGVDDDLRASDVTLSRSVCGSGAVARLANGGRLLRLGTPPELNPTIDVEYLLVVAQLPAVARAPAVEEGERADVVDPVAAGVFAGDESLASAAGGVGSASSPCWAASLLSAAVCGP